MNERPDLYEYQQTIFKRFNMKTNQGTRAKFGQSELQKRLGKCEDASKTDVTGSGVGGIESVIDSF